MKRKGTLLILCFYHTAIFFSGYTTCEKELYARILDTIPILMPVIEGCAINEQAFDQFVKLVSIYSRFPTCTIKNDH